MTIAASLNVPSPDFPVVGNYFPVGFLFLCHMAVAQYSLGAITLAAPMELWAVRHGGDPRGMRYAKALANSYYLVFSLGATLALFAITVMLGLWGRLFADLVNHFLPLVGLAFGLFVVLAPLLVWYRNSFESMRERRHVLLGFAVLFWQTLFLVCIVVVDADMMTPGPGGWFGGFTTASYWPLLGHRLVGNVSWTALFLAGLAAIKLTRSADEGERAFQSWAAGINLRIGVLTGVLMPLSGLALIEVLRRAVPDYFNNLLNGSASWLFVVQAAMLAVVVVGGNIALALEEHPWAGADRLGRGCTLVSLAGMVIGVLPSQVITPSILWVRYAGILVAIAATLLHVIIRTGARRPAPVVLAPGAMGVLPFTVSRGARRALATIGVVAFALSMFMGVIKDQARGGYAIEGELTQRDAHQHFEPSGIYP